MLPLSKCAAEFRAIKCVLLPDRRGQQNIRDDEINKLMKTLHRDEQTCSRSQMEFGFNFLAQDFTGAARQLVAEIGFDSTRIGVGKLVA